MAAIKGITTSHTVVFEETRVMRYAALPETIYGFTLPDPALGVPNIRSIAFETPGVIEIPSILLFRTRHTGKPSFRLDINRAILTRYTFNDDDPPERSWHEIIPAYVHGNDKEPGGPTLRSQENYVIFVTSGDGTVTFGDVAILYTSNEVSLKIPIVFNPQPIVEAVADVSLIRAAAGSPNVRLGG